MWNGFRAITLIMKQTVIGALALPLITPIASNTSPSPGIDQLVYWARLLRGCFCFEPVGGFAQGFDEALNAFSALIDD